MDSIKGTISSVGGASSTQAIDDSSSQNPDTTDPPPSTMDSIKGTINSVIGTSSTPADDERNKHLKPTPPETGLQSRGQTIHSGTGSFLGEMKDMVNSAVGAGGTKEEKELALDKGQDTQENKDAVAQAGDEQISEFIRDKYHSTASGDLKNKDN